MDDSFFSDVVKMHAACIFKSQGKNYSETKNFKLILYLINLRREGIHRMKLLALFTFASTATGMVIQVGTNHFSDFS